MSLREAMAARLADGECFDLVVIGGGANGAGIALDAASRGLNVALVERNDFGSGTSSRSSKLIHGGVRYVSLGQWGLVRQALAERAVLLKNAAAIVQPLRFLIPAYGYFDVAKFRLGLKFYDWLAGDHGLRLSEWLSAEQAAAQVPAMATSGLLGATAYDDALFDDCRLLISILAKARELGAVTMNYREVVEIVHDSRQRAVGVVVRDRGGATELTVSARVVINATGPYGDTVRQLDSAQAASGLSPSQGAHVVVAGRFLGGDRAMVLPRTADGRIMFAIPWYDHVLLGSTDTPVREAAAAPRPFADEIDAILACAAAFLDPAPTRRDVLSTFAGVRPLAGKADGSATVRRSREHVLEVSNSGLITVSGGKWTTYRLVAAEAVDLALKVGSLSAAPSKTDAIELAPAGADVDPRFMPWAAAAGDLHELVARQPALGDKLHPELPYCGAHFVWAARAEFAISVSDALAYRTRAMFLNARAAADIAAAVAALMAAELGHDANWIERETDAARSAAAGFSLSD